jgi:hypothetical protein
MLRLPETSGPQFCKRRLRAGVLSAVVVAVISVCFPLSAGASTVGIVPPADPAANCALPTSLEDDALSAIDYCRAQEQVGPITLPTNWSALNAGQQLLVIINLERVGRGLAPIVGLNSQIDAVAQTAANDHADPGFPSGGGIYGGGSIWAGLGSTLSADYAWMYYDGPGGINLDCMSGNTSGCFGHRNNILIDQLSYRLIGGAGYGTDSYAFEMDFDPNSNYPEDAYTWVSELPYFPVQPATDPLPVPAIATISPYVGPPSGGTTVTITGSALSALTTLSVGQTQLTNLRCSSDQTCTAVTAPGASGTYVVTGANPAGSSTSGPEFTYTGTPASATPSPNPPSSPVAGSSNNPAGSGHSGTTSGTTTTTTTQKGSTETVTTIAPAGVKLTLSKVRIVHHRLSFRIHFRSGSATVSVSARRGRRTVRLRSRRKPREVLVSGTLGSGHWVITVHYVSRTHARARGRSTLKVKIG